MKRKVMLIGFCLTLLAMGLPQDVGAQNKGRVIKMEIKEERLTDALKHLEKVSGYKILFSYDDMNRFKVSNKVIKTHDIRHALNVLISSNPIEYQIDGQYVNVFLKETVSRTGVAQLTYSRLIMRWNTADVSSTPHISRLSEPPYW